MARHGTNLVISGARTLGTVRAMRVGAVIATTLGNRPAAKADAGTNVESGFTPIRRQHETLPSETSDVSVRVNTDPASDARKMSNTKSPLLPEISLAPTSSAVIPEPLLPVVESVAGKTRNELIASPSRETTYVRKKIRTDIATPTRAISGRQEKFSGQDTTEGPAVLNAKPGATFRRPPKVDFTALGAAEQAAREPTLFAGRPVRIEHVPNLATVEPATRRSLQAASVSADSKTQIISSQRDRLRQDTSEWVTPSAPVRRPQAAAVSGVFEGKNSPPPQVHATARPVPSPSSADAAGFAVRSSRVIEPAKPSTDSRISIGRLEVQVIQENTVQQSAYAPGRSSFDDAYQLERSYIRNLGRT